MTHRLDPKKDPARRCLKPEQWPALDRAAWLTVIEPGNILELGGRGAEWAPLTRHNIARCYGGWLTWLDRSGLLDPTLEPADRVGPERVVQYINDLRTRSSGYTVLSRIRALCTTVQAMAPDRDWRWLQKINRRLRNSVKPKRKKETLIVPVDHLWSYGLELMHTAETSPNLSDLARAAQYRDGLIIAFLAARPIRRRNLAAIEIGRHLVRRGERYWICLPAAETKTRVPYEAPIPYVLVSFLERYLTRHRPFLVQHTGRWGESRPLQDPGDRLWISNYGSAMSEGAIYGRVIKLTSVRFGHGINLHLFRDIAGTSIAVEDPGHVQITTSLLGHTTLATSEKHYNHARSLEATRRYQAHVLALRRR